MPCTHWYHTSDRPPPSAVAGRRRAVATQSQSQKATVEPTSTKALHMNTLGPGIDSSACAAACASTSAGTATTAEARRKLLGSRASSAISEP
eukprot:scaffold13150_cov62-Phaeocystis_antarctica.AAC.4